MIRYFTPYSETKDLGRAYNSCMNLIGPQDWACLMDGDTMFLTPDWGSIISEYTRLNPGCVLVCRTNRIHEVATEQQGGIHSQDILDHILYANILKEKCFESTACHGPLSGFLMVIPKQVWEIVSFAEGIGLLGVDTKFFKDIRRAGIPIRRMDGLYVWHTYRLGKEITDTNHLKC